MELRLILGSLTLGDVGLKTHGFKIIDTPPSDDCTLSRFEDLPLDPYAGSTQRYRRSRSFALSTKVSGN